MLSSRRRTAASEGFGCVEAVLQGFALSPSIAQCPVTGEAGRAGRARKVGHLHVVRVQPDAVCYEHSVLTPVLVEVPSALVAVLEEQIFCFAGDRRKLAKFRPNCCKRRSSGKLRFHQVSLGL